MSRTLEVFYLCLIPLWKESHSFFIVVFLCIITVAYFMFLLQILYVDLQEFHIMLLEAQQRLCQNCFCCWKRGLRLLSQSYSHRCVTKLILKRLQTFSWLHSVLKSHLFWFNYYWFYFIAYRRAVNYYEILGVTSNASLEEIKNAFFEKSKKVRSLFPSIHST